MQFELHFLSFATTSLLVGRYFFQLTSAGISDRNLASLSFPPNDCSPTTGHTPSVFTGRETRICWKTPLISHLGE